GVSPSDIETLVTQPLERELKELKDVEEMSSTSAEGISIITIEFTPEANIDEALQKVREKVDLARPDLPKDAEDPVITEISFSDWPIIILTLSGDVGPVRLKAIGEDLEEKIEQIPGVLEVNLNGGVEREIQVLVDPKRLAYYHVTLDDVMHAVQGENVNLPGGDIDVGSASYLVRVPADFKHPEEISDLVVKMKGGKPVFVRDVARVVDGFKDRATLARLDGREAISLGVTKRTGENIIRIIDEIKALVAREAENFPPGTEVAFLNDQSKQIRQMVQELENNILSGLLLVLGVLFVALTFNTAILVAVAIPLSMLITFVVLQVLGITLNMVVLFSLILALGMLVDNAIVIVENIYRHASMGKPMLRATQAAVLEVAWPVTTSTITTLSAFFPLLFWPGIMGKFMGFLPRTLIIALSASLFVALVMNPVLSKRFLRVPKGRLRDPDLEVEDNAFVRLYRRSLIVSLRHPILVVVLGVLSLVGTIFAYGKLGQGVEFFPETTPEKAIINIEAPLGTRLEATNEIVREIESYIATLDGVETFVSIVGGAQAQRVTDSNANAPNKAQINIDLDPDRDPWGTIARIRAFTATITGAEIDVEKEKVGPPSGAPIAVELSGPDFAELGRLAHQLRERIKGIEGIVDLKDDYALSRPEIQVIVDRTAAQQAKTSTGRIAATIRTAINGSKASTLREAEDEYDITVRLDEPFRRSIDDLENLAIPGDKGVPIPLSELAELRMLPGAGAIRHKETKRVVTVRANVTGRLANDVLHDVQTTLADFALPAGYSLRYAGENEEQDKARAFLAKAFVVGLFLIFLTLVTQFNSVVLPVIILISVILSLIGVLWGLIVTATPFGVIMTGLGVISLAGVVVNNAIVLIDFIQQLRSGGMQKLEAIVMAGQIRLRPVLLTAVTTILGLIPMAIGWSIDFSHLKIAPAGRSGEWWAPMAIAVIFGLTLATLLTLIVVPVLYRLLTPEAWFDEESEEVSS
ncbi:MAG: efflux RND transporter permease subunit, partial [Deltaproteobacteria bacterium]